MTGKRKIDEESRREGGGRGRDGSFLGLVSRLVDAQLEFCISASLQIIQMYVNICYIIIGSLLARKKLKANSSSVTIVFFFSHRANTTCSSWYP